MPNAVSSFLRAGREFDESPPPGVDSSEILRAIGMNKASDRRTLSKDFNVAPAALEQGLEDLLIKEMLKEDDGRLSLTDAGQRAFRYLQMS